jgi:hypothetical protein
MLTANTYWALPLFLALVQELCMLTPQLGGSMSHLYFIDGATKAQRGQVACPGRSGWLSGETAGSSTESWGSLKASHWHVSQ